MFLLLLHLIKWPWCSLQRITHCETLWRYLAVSKPYSCLCFRGVHLDLRAKPAHQAPPALPGQTASMWVSCRFVTKAVIVLEKYQLRTALQYWSLTSRGPHEWKHIGTKELCSQQWEVVFEKGPSPQYGVCLTVMWYICATLRVNCTQVVCKLPLKQSKVVECWIYLDQLMSFTFNNKPKAYHLLTGSITGTLIRMGILSWDWSIAESLMLKLWC